MKKIAKREAGDGSAISYVLFYLLIIIAYFFFAYSQFNANLYILKNQMETVLHIAEGYALTVAYVDSGTNLERDLSKRHIITDETKYVKQCALVGNAFSNRIKDEFSLAGDGVTPTKGMLYQMTRPWLNNTNPGNKASLLISSPLVIYEPTYSETVTTTKNSSGEITGFIVNGTITGWTKYEIYFDSANNYDASRLRKIPVTSGVNVGGVITPTLKNGNPCEGATMEATITVPFYGMNKLFVLGSEVSSSPNRFEVAVTQSVDIVLANMDSRKQ